MSKTLLKLLITCCVFFTVFMIQENAVAQTGTAVTMTLQNAIQTSPSEFEYDVMLTNSGSTALLLRGYSCGVNHAAGMSNGGTIGYTFVSRDPVLSTIPVVTFAYTAASNHMRFTTVNATTGNEVALPSGVPVRLATMRVTNTVNFPADFNPAMNLQTIVASGKTQCIVTCIVTPPGTNFALNGPGNIPSAGTLQVLNGVVNTPCFYLSPSGSLSATVSSTTPTICDGQSNGTAQITLSGTGSGAPAGSSGTYSVNGGSPVNYTSNPFIAGNLAAGTYTISVSTSYGCTSGVVATITQPLPISTSFNGSICNGTYTLPWGTVVSAAGAYTHVYTTASGCDSTVTANLSIQSPTVNPPTTAVACDTYTWNVNNQTYTSSGTYIASFLNAAGCDSNFTLNLTINNSTSSSLNITACDNYTWSANSISYTASGVYTFTSLNAQGCPFVQTLNLTIRQSSASNSTVSVINSYTWAANGTTYTNSGTYTHTMLNAVGCDSVATLNLTISQLAVTMTLQNAVQTAPNVFEYDVMMTYTGTSAIALRGYSCGVNHASGMSGGGTLTQTFVSRDAALSTIPSVSAAYTSSTNHLRLTTLNATAGNEVLLATGVPVRLATMRVTNTINFSADFNPALALQVLSASGKTACVVTGIVTPPGISYVMNGIGNSPIAGTVQVLNGVVNVSCFYLNPVASFTVNQISNPVPCFGQSNGSVQVTLSGTGSASPAGSTGTYTINGGSPIVYSSNPFMISNLAAGTYTINVTTSYGCSGSSVSVITAPLSPIAESSSFTACDSYIWGGTTYTNSGVYVHTFITAAGCDSVHTLTLTIHHSSTGSSSVTSCGSYVWNGTTYTTSGNYTQTFINAEGCDSVHTLQATIYPNSGTTNLTVCNSYTWNGVTYTANATATHTYLASTGCDSVQTLHLTVNYSNSSTTNAVVNISYLWNANNVTYTNSGTYTHTLTNSTGCDSTLTLNLTVLQQAAAVTMTIQNAVQISPNEFEYDVMLTNNSVIGLALRGYSCGINHASGMNASGTITHSYVSRDPLLASLPSVSPGYTAATNHIRLTTVNASAGNEVVLPVGVAVRLATMRITTSAAAFSTEFNPALSLQLLSASGKTSCIATCLLTPPGSTFALNSAGNTPLLNSLQVLTGVVNTPCFYLNPIAPFAANASSISICYGQTSGSTTVALSGTGSSAPLSTSGTFILDGGSAQAYTTNPFSLTNLAPGTHTVNVTSSGGCNSVSVFSINQPSAPLTGSLNVSACVSYLWEGTTYTNSGNYIHTYTTAFGCDSVVTLQLTINQLPVVTAADVSGCAGAPISLSGSPAGGIFSVTDPYIGPSTTYTYTYTDINGCTATSAPASITVIVCDDTLNLKLFIQGYYAGSSTMTPALFNQGETFDNTVTDTIVVEIHDENAPYGVIDSRMAILQTDGTASCTFPNATASYYVAIKHRNGLQTWSALPVQFGIPSISYDFTTTSSQAYGDNMFEVESGVWAFYSGDLNLDENIDLLDIPILEDGINNFYFGYYSSDLNGDGNVDLLDVPVIEDNINNFIFSYHP